MTPNVLTINGLKMMLRKHSKLCGLLSVCCGILLSCHLVMAQAPAQPVKQAAAKKPKRSMLFKAPLRGAPLARVGGGIRGAEGEEIVFSVLNPDQTGLTTKEQPSLYWYQSRPAMDMEFELTLNSGDETLLEFRLSQAPDVGVQKLDLAALHISLEPDVSYEWVVALIADPYDRAKDITSSAFIKRVSLSQELHGKLQAEDRAQHPYIYAEEGIWYDALESLSLTVEASPNDQSLLLERIELFDQVGLSKVADQERSRIGIVK